MLAWLAMRRGHRRPWLVLVALALVAPGCDFMCGKGKPGAGADASAGDAPVGMEVLSAGGEPRAKLEVGRWAGLEYVVELESDGSFGRTGDPPIQAPTLVMKTRVEVLRGTADPLIQERDGKPLRLVEERATLERIGVRSATAPADFIGKVNEALGLLKGLTTRALIAENAEILEVTTEHLGGVVPPPEIKGFLDEALGAQRSFPLRLPPVPVGVGARWRFSVPLEIKGVKATHVADLTLVELTASTARIGIRARQQAPNQEVPHPTIPGLRASLAGLRGDSDGEVTLDRLTACIVAARFSSTTYQTMTWLEPDGNDRTATFMHASVQRIRGRVGSAGDAGDLPEAAVVERPDGGSTAPPEEDEGE